jgi:hypothetical protein
MTEIFKTIHGSRLYGWERSSSDYDWFVVTDSVAPKARQRVVGNVDMTTVGMNAFLIRALGGSHQSVEAMFSPYKQWNPEFLHLKPFIDSTVVCGSAVYAKYERTIKKFCYGNTKSRRHAARLSLNLADLRESGRFNPAMSQNDIDFCTKMATRLEGEELWQTLIEE